MKNYIKTTSRLTARFFAMRIVIFLVSGTTTLYASTPAIPLMNVASSKQNLTRESTTIKPKIQIKTTNNMIPSKQVKNSPNITPLTLVKNTTDATTQKSTPKISPPSKLLSFNFQGILVSDLLRIIANIKKIDYILSPDIKDKMNINMHDATWDTALEAVLSINNLSYLKYGKIWWIGPTEEVIKRKKTLQNRMATEGQDGEINNSFSRIFHLKFSEASTIKSALTAQSKVFLSQDGAIEVDERTNSIWVYNTRTNLDKIASFIETFDKPAKQVLIRARMITLDSSYNREFGIRLGVTKPTPLFGNMGSAVSSNLDDSTALGLINANAPNLSAKGQIDAVGLLPVSSRLNFDFPATTLFANSASLGVALIKIGSVFLDLEISAMVSEGHAEMIANPSIITANKKAARIEHGKQVPYPSSSFSGDTTVTFHNVALSLDVTPKIMHDGIVDLEIKVDNNSLGELVTGTGAPSINTQSVNSHVFLRDGETVVLGGIYSKTINNTVNRVPLLADIPLIGRLFQKKHWKEVRKEVIIFITPEIIESTPEPKSYDKESYKVISDFMAPFKHIQKKSFLSEDQIKEFEDPQDINVHE